MAHGIARVHSGGGGQRKKEKKGAEQLQIAKGEETPVPRTVRKSGSVSKSNLRLKGQRSEKRNRHINIANIE
jgi:hypothetical protein